MLLLLLMLVMVLMPSQLTVTSVARFLQVLWTMIPEVVMMTLVVVIATRLWITLLSFVRQLQ